MVINTFSNARILIERVRQKMTTIHIYRTANGMPGQQDMTRFYMKRYRHEEEEEDILAF